MADPDRKGGHGLSLRTLVIASAASLTAAMVTSRVFPPGTIYASALTPVIVAAVSEMLHRPVDRVSELRRQRRTLAMEAARAPYGEEGAPLRGAPGFAQGAAAEEELAPANGNGAGGPGITIHGRRRGLLHPKVWIATGLAAFVIAFAALTLPELIFGGAIASNHRTTYLGGGGSSSSTKTETTTTPTKTAPQTTVTETVPAQTTPQSTDTQTATTPTQTTTTDTGTQTSPSGGAPAPADTTTAPPTP
jgi:hypothetical protein